MFIRIILYFCQKNLNNSLTLPEKKTQNNSLFQKKKPNMFITIILQFCQTKKYANSEKTCSTRYFTNSDNCL